MCSCRWNINGDNDRKEGILKGSYPRFLGGGARVPIPLHIIRCDHVEIKIQMDHIRLYMVMSGMKIIFIQHL